MNGWKLSTYALTAALMASLSMPLIRSAEAETQPHMRSALSQLEAAKHSLEKAEPDKGGHRVRALELVKQAIDEVKAGIKHHKHKGKGKGDGDGKPGDDGNGTKPGDDGNGTKPGDGGNGTKP
jgi:hypothetical protein